MTGNAGLGKETILKLAEHQPECIWLAARSQSKAEAAISEIKQAVPGAPITYLPLDLASFKSVSEAAKKFNDSSSRLDILVNNAGIMMVPAGKTEDGFEIQFGTNVMGSFLFTKLLLPKLQSTAKLPGADVRVVNLSSEAHRGQTLGGLILDETKMANFGPSTAYANSKLANILYAREFARRYPEITSVSVHPGIIAGTALWEPFKNQGFLQNMGSKLATMVLPNVEQGTRNQLWAATCKKDEIKNGQYYTPIGSASGGSGKASSTAKDAELWDWAENECKKRGY